jgi:hypothetical protein
MSFCWQRQALPYVLGYTLLAGAGGGGARAQAPQNGTPQPSTGVVTPPAAATPAPPKKAKKGDTTPANDTGLCEVTLRAEVYGQGPVSSMRLTILALASNQSASSTTDPSGELKVGLAAGDYQIDGELGSAHVRQNIHVTAGGKQLVLLNVPAQGGASSPVTPRPR